jgi:hypothetical protein
MENLDLFILTAIVSLSFFGFGYTLYKAQKDPRDK